LWARCPCRREPSAEKQLGVRCLGGGSLSEEEEEEAETKKERERESARERKREEERRWLIEACKTSKSRGLKFGSSTPSCGWSTMPPPSQAADLEHQHPTSA